MDFRFLPKKRDKNTRKKLTLKNVVKLLKTKDKMTILKPARGK